MLNEHISRIMSIANVDPPPSLFKLLLIMLCINLSILNLVLFLYINMCAMQYC